MGNITFASSTVAWPSEYIKIDGRNGKCIDTVISTNKFYARGTDALA